VAAPFSIVEPVLDALGIQDLRQTIGFVACVIPFASAEDDAHVIVFPWVGHVRQVFVGTIELNVVIMIAIEKWADVERAAQANEMTNGVRMTKSDIRSVIRAQAGATNGDSVRRAFLSREIEHITHDYIFIRVVSAHSVGWVD
jgi:hypothetical protein